MKSQEKTVNYEKYPSFTTFLIEILFFELLTGFDTSW